MPHKRAFFISPAVPRSCHTCTVRFFQILKCLLTATPPSRRLVMCKLLSFATWRDTSRHENVIDLLLRRIKLLKQCNWISTVFTLWLFCQCSNWQILKRSPLPSVSVGAFRWVDSVLEITFFYEMHYINWHLLTNLATCYSVVILLSVVIRQCKYLRYEWRR